MPDNSAVSATASIEAYNRPWLFYGLSTVLPWAFWFAAAYVSHLTPQTPGLAALMSGLCVAGLAMPILVAAALTRNRPHLRRDMLRRLWDFRGVRLRYIALACGLMPASILAAMGVSLLFGHSAEQFQFAGRFSFTAGLFPAWFLLILAPIMEELAWHSYGTDCLVRRMNLFAASVLFAVYWALWHFPLGFIKDYYHANLAESGVLYSLNFVVSLIPFVLLMNWLYYKAGRNITVAVVFHVTAGLFNEIFRTHPDSKVIQTGLLLLVCAYLLVAERSFFFRRDALARKEPSAAAGL